MWDLDTIIRINQKAAEKAREQVAEPVAEKPEQQGEVITLPSAGEARRVA